MSATEKAETGCKRTGSDRREGVKDGVTPKHTPEGGGNKLRRCPGRPWGERADGS